MTTILGNLGFANINLTTVETFPAGTYNVTLYAEFAGYCDENELSYYQVNTSVFTVIFTGLEGGSGYIDPPISESFTADYQLGLSMLSPDGECGTHRYFTETARNPDYPEQHAKVYENLDDPGMFLIGFENLYGGGDRDFNDMVFSLKAKQPPVACFTVSNDRPNVCETVTFNATCSYDPDGTIVKYEWDWEGDCTYDYDAGDNPIATHHYDTYGTYYPKLRVTDNNGLTDETNTTILVRAHPVACFAWTPEKPQVCETVYFNASCSTPDGGDIISYEWDFGDGSDHEFGMVVTHHYDTFGNYTVTLNVTDGEGKWDTESKIITIRAHPHADFTWSPLSPQVGEQVTFNASASTPDGGTIVSYYWDFGDSNSDSGEIVYHSYSAFGNFTVTLNVTDSEGKWDIESKNITVRQHPVASFTWLPLYPQPCEEATFDASSSTPDGGTIISYEWDFGDESPHEFGMVVTHHYTAHGNYEVVLNVTDSEGKWDTESKTVTVRAPPHADFEWTPTSPQVCEWVIFDASASYDPDGSIVNYTWNFDDGNITSTTAPIITHHYKNHGTYNVTLTVTDNHGKTDSVMHPVTVREHPVACFTYSPTHPQVCGDITFNASCSTPDGGTLMNYTWNFDDGTPPVTENDPITTHHYTEPGTFNVTLTVVDSEGKSDTTWKTVVVAARPHACFTLTPSSPQVFETVTFNASCSTPDGGVIVSYEWSFGDGDFGSGKITTHHYDTYGTFNVTLNVTDSEGKWDMEWHLITVRAHPHAEFTFSPSCPQVSETVTFDASASTPNGGTITSYEWNFGDGDSGTGKIATHHYTQPGQYDVTLKVTDSEGKWDTEQKLIKVWEPPEACFTEDTATPDINQTVTFDASCSKPGHDSSSERAITEYRWDFDDGTPIVVEYDPIAEYTYTEAGTYTVTLTIYAPPGPDACPAYEPYDTTTHLKSVAPPPPPPCVGGEMILIKVDKPGVGPSSVELTAALLTAIVVMAVVVKRRRKT